MQRLSPSPPRAQSNNNIDPDVPAYVVIEKRGFFDDSDKLWEKGSMIYWEGTPNLGFEPLNEIAEEKMREYLVYLDEKAQDVSDTKGTSHASLVNAFEARRRIQEMDRTAGRSVDREEQVPILRAQRYEDRKARSISEGVGQSTPLMGHAGKQSVAQKQARKEATRKAVGKTGEDNDGAI